MNRPRVILSGACTIDGKIATHTGDSAISSDVDRRRLHALRATTDAILVGTNTLLRDDPLLNVRHVSGPDPTRVILDPAGQIPDNSRILTSCGDIPTIIVVSSRISAVNRRRVSSFPVSIIESDSRDIPISWLLERLYIRGIRSLLLEGGGQTNWRFLQADAIDEIVLTVSPYLVGGPTSLVGGHGLNRIADSACMRLISVVRQGDEVVLHYTKCV